MTMLRIDILVRSVFLLALLQGFTAVEAKRNKGFMVLRSPFYKEKVNETAQEISSLMRTACLEDRIVVTFNQRLMRRAGIAHTQIQLNDPQCIALSNNTHYVLTAQFSGNTCGSTVGTVKSHPVIRRIKNAVNVVPPIDQAVLSYQDNDDDDFVVDGSGMENVDYERSFSLPFYCDYTEPSSVQILPKRSKTTPKSLVSNEQNFFELELFTSDTFMTAIRKVSFNVKRDRTLYAEVIPQSGSVFEKAFIHSCYLTNINMDEDQRYYYIRNGCPVDESVEFLSESDTGHGYRRFKFQMRKAFEQMTTMHCQIEPCYTRKRSMADKLLKCETQTTYCERNSQNRMSQSMQSKLFVQVEWKQFVVVADGPFNQEQEDTSSAIQHPDSSDTPKCLVSPDQSKTCDCNNNSSRRNGMSVSLTVTLVVAAISFCMGAALVVGIWCVYVQTDPRRRMTPVSISDDGSQNSHTPIKLMAEKHDTVSGFGR